MSHYETLPPANFLGLDEETSSYNRSGALVLPIPYEGTVSYGQGTRNGQRAIIVASHQVELYDRELDSEPAVTYGILTLPALAPVIAGPEPMVDAIAACAEEHLRTGKLLVGLGGEHTVSAGIARAVKAVFGDFVMVQIDAHSDLRASYEGSPYSHACVARRVLDQGATVVQLGIRSICREEIELIRSERSRLRVFFAEDVHAGQYLRALAGLLWSQVLDIVRTVTREGNLVAFDCVELAPIAGQHVSDFLTAKLIYKTIGLALSSRGVPSAAP